MSQTKAQLIDPTDGSIVNADINASAAIAGTKIAPNFGSQAVSTTGDLTVDGGVLKIDSSNNRVGIGTTSPVTDIHTVSSSDHIITHQSSSAGADIRMNFRDAGNTDQGGIHYLFNGNSLKFITSTSERMRIDSSGKVGIGKTPSSMLDIETISNQNGFNLNCIGTPANYFLNIRDDNVSKFYIDSSGHVGIGDTSPAELLTLRDATPRIRLEDSDTTNAACQFVGDNASVLIQADTAGVVNDSTISFAIDAAERMRIDSSGRVGIGVTSPAAILHTQSSAGDELEGLRIINSHADANAIDTAFIRLGITNAGGIKTTQIAAVQESNGSNAVALRFGTNSSGSNNGETEKMRILGSGNVGIGTTAPDEKLHVAGNIINTTSVSGTGDSGIQIANNHRLGFDQSGTRSWSIKATDGCLVIDSGDGGSAPRVRGLLFGSDTADANRLDDYEEGTFTPVLKGTGGGGTLTGQTGAGSGGNYTKIGNKVHFSFYFANPNGSNPSGTLYFEMPFSAASGLAYNGSGGCVTYTRNINPGSGRMFAVNAIAGSNRLYLTRVSVGGEGETNYQNISDDSNLSSMLFKVTVTFVAA